MPNKSQDHVHRLIHSMSRAEKRYYKLHLARNGHEHGGNQELLFDAIATMERYDEHALIERFNGASFTRHFAITKRRLYESILRSLEAFHAQSSTDARINAMLHQVEILHHRALYADAVKILGSARKLAERHERIAPLIAVREWERRLTECGNYDRIDAAAIDRMTLADAEARGALEEIDALWALKSRMFLLLYRQGASRSATARSGVRELLAHPLLADAQEPQSAKARYLRQHILSAAAFALGRNEECRTRLEGNLGLLERERDCFADEPSLVLGVVSNLAYVSMLCGQYDKAWALLRKFRALPGQWRMPENDDLDVKIFATTISLELSIHLRLGEFGKALELLPVMERGLVEHAQRLSPVRKAAFHYQLAYAHFGAGHLDQAQRWTNALLNGARADDESDAVRAGRLLHLILLWETGKTEPLKYALRNTKRYVDAHAAGDRFAPLLLHLLAGLVHAQDAEKAHAHLRRFLHEAGALAQEAAHPLAFEHFDLLAWATSRLTGESFGELVRRNTEKLAPAA